MPQCYNIYIYKNSEGSQYFSDVMFVVNIILTKCLNYTLSRIVSVKTNQDFLLYLSTDKEIKFAHLLRVSFFYVSLISNS